MKKLIILSFLVIALSCEDETNLSESILVADTEYPELPAYTDWGYNTFGVNYERSIFTYSDDEIPLKVIVKNNEINFLFQGIEGGYTNNYMALKFSMPVSNIVSWQDLISFNQTIINLTGENITVELTSNTDSQVLDIIDGEINFKKSQKVFIDDTEKGIILSGTFYLKFIHDQIPESMSNGRFDFAIDNANFYIL